MHVSSLIAAMERLAPPTLAESWDNTGLILGDAAHTLDGPILLTIDLTESVVAEAIALGAAAVVSYHPPLFHAVKRLTTSTSQGRALLQLAAHEIAVYSPHTALDAAPDGMTDWLADGVLPPKPIGATAAHADRRSLNAHAHRPPTQEVKIVTFLPEAKVGDVRSALATAGAGLIGDYELCAFASAGTGSFFGKVGTTPATGAAGQLELVPEVRLEMVCSRRGLALALQTLRRFHPYEEPAIDVYDLVAQPSRNVGSGRRLVLDHPASLHEIAERLKSHLNIRTLKVACAGFGVPDRAAGPRDIMVSCIGLCCGAGASLAGAALAEGCQLFVTGEMTHHEVMAMLQSGMSVMLAGHTNTERGYLPRLRDRLSPALPGVSIVVSREDRSPFAYV
jgi:dinuclear metal center YbgI/SA1388 family protein